MPISKALNGAAIVSGIAVPPAEFVVLQALAAVGGGPTTVPALSVSMDEELSDAALYALLNRLASDKRNLVEKREHVYEVAGNRIRRVVYELRPVARNAFKESRHATESARPLKAPQRELQS